MGIIHVLDISVANLIAAGEVVERPCNAAKELVENAIDAGATQITVEIKRGGISFLRVTDNGCGMSGEDAVTALRRHATSKIKSASDLAAIGTLGFRGEALAAITAVSEYRILTKRADDEEGTLIVGAYGKTEEIAPTGCPDGTTIICERLFATTPARLKFLKSDASEGSAVMGMMEKLALSHPEIAFRFLSDGNLKLSTSGDGVLKNAIYSVLGSAFAGKMIAVQGGSRGIRVEGYVSSPDFVRGNRAMQQFFINERSVRSKSLTASLEAAFASYLAPQKYPSCVLNIAISPTLVDVNIHPAKLEVKFSDEKAVFDALYSAVRGALVSAVSRPVLAFTEESMRLEGNQAVLQNKGTGEQMKLEMSFRAAAEKGEKSEKGAEKDAFSAKNIEQNAQKVEKNEQKTVPAREKTDFFDVKSDEIRAKLYGETTNVTVKKQEPIPDDDITVDVPILRDVPMNPLRRHGLASDSAIEDFEARSRLYAEKAAMAKPAVEHIPPVTVKEASPSEEAFRPEIGSTDACLKGEEAKPIPPYRIVGEVFQSYVILEVEDKMLLIDKHAAHERINFEKMKRELDAERSHSQLLLVPDTLSMTEEEIACCDQYRAELEKLGFSFEIEGKTVKLSGIPVDTARNEALSLFGTLVSEMLESGTPILENRRGQFEKALYQTACKAAVKAGRRYDEAHIRWICENLLRYDCIKFCPHGRPVAFELSKKELDARFGRT